MKKKILMLASVVLCILLAGCQCKHEWVEADCITPKTCSQCGETEGEAMGHRWQDATCEAPQTCSRCGIAEGNKADHQYADWMLLDYNTMRRTCSNCALEETAPMERDLFAELYLKNTSWNYFQNQYPTCHVSFGDSQNFHMRLPGGQYNLLYDGTWEFTEYQEGETAVGYHLMLTDESTQDTAHLVLIGTREEEPTYYLTQQSTTGYVIYSLHTFPDIAGTWEINHIGDWVTEDTPIRVEIADDGTATVATQQTIYTGTVAEDDGAVADALLGGLNNRAYRIDLEGSEPVYLLLGSDGLVHMSREGSTWRFYSAED